MDIKTLEYMEERASKARGVVKKIETLKENIEKLDEVGCVSFRDARDRYLFNTFYDEDLTKQMKTAYVQVAEEEIVLLEQELAEL